MTGFERGAAWAARGLAFAVVLGAAISSARADELRAAERSKRAAQEHLDRGNDLFYRDEFQRALAELQAAYDLYPSPKLHFNLGQCERALGHMALAASHFEAFLASSPDVAPELRAEAQRYLAEARAPVAPDPPETSTAPTPRTAPAPVVEPPRAVAVAVPPAPAPALAPPAVLATPAPRPVYARWWFWAAVGVVVVGAALTTVTLMRPSDPACPTDAQTCL